MSGSRPYLIGLTGNIGTGKSTVAGMLAELGAETIDADKVAHEAMQPGTSVHAQIVEAFGADADVVTPGGRIDRERLGAIVFSDSEALARLEAIVHPATLEMIDKRIEASSSDVIVIEAIKLFEAGMAETCDSVWVTTCSPEQQVQRIMAARDLSRAQAEQRVQAQPPQEEKIDRADVVIHNRGALSRTRAQVEAAWRRLVEGD